MNLWKDFYDNFAPGDSGFLSLPQLVFVCEDDKHMAETFKTLVTNKINIQNTAQNLASLIQSFLAACESISTVNGGALTPASKQLFTDLKGQFEELLQ